MALGAGDLGLPRRIGPFADPARACDAALLLDLACDADTIVFSWTPSVDRLDLRPAPTGPFAALAGARSIGGPTGLAARVHARDRFAAARALLSLSHGERPSADLKLRVRNDREEWTSIDVRARRGAGRRTDAPILGIVRRSSSTGEIGTLAARLILAEERVRQRIAEGLHDDLGQNLAVVKAALRDLQKRLDGGDSETNLPLLLDLLDRAIASTRSLTFELSSPILHRLGLVAAFRNALDKLAREHGLGVALDTEGEPLRLPPALETLVHRSVQELLRNAARHSGASNVRVALRRSDRELQVTVSDDGRGFDAGDRLDHLSADGGFGLFSIGRALEYVSGRFAIDSAPGRGTRATVAVPLEAPR